jgi:hypothetical protein
VIPNPKSWWDDVNPPLAETKYLEFHLLEKKPKTEVYGVYSKRHGMSLGTIKWHGSWRQYAFFPELNTLFNSECLKDIRAFIDGLMGLRKK